MQNVTCALIGTDLETCLRNNGYHHLVITGVITNHSVKATARVAGNLGLDTLVVSGATVTFDKWLLSGEWFKTEQVRYHWPINKMNTPLSTRQVPD